MVELKKQQASVGVREKPSLVTQDILHKSAFLNTWANVNRDQDFIHSLKCSSPALKTLFQSENILP